MDFVNLRYFIETYEKKSLTAASKQLNISEQGLSKAIRTLEREWDFPMFTRYKNRLSPTAFGDAFYIQARHLMDEYEKSCHILENAKTENSVLHMGFGNCVLSALNMEELVSEYKKIYPDVKVYFQNESDYMCEQMLEKDELDVIFCMDPPPGHNFYRQLIAKEKIYAILPADHRLSQFPFLSVKDLENIPVICAAHNSKAYEHVLKDFQEAHIEPDIVLRSNEPLVYLKMVRENMGIGMVPAHWLSLFANDDDIISLEITDIKERGIYMAAKQTGSENSVVASFLRFMKSQKAGIS